MRFNFTVFLIILACVVVTPLSYAQVLNENSMQKSVKVMINSDGDVHVTHVIKSSNSPHQVDLIKGTISDLTVKDQRGNEIQFAMIDENSLIIFSSKSEVIIDYNLSDVLSFENNVWSWNFLYLESTSFYFPDGVDLVFVDDKPAFLADKKGIICHGCQMKLEFLLDEPEFIKEVNIQNEKLPVEFKTWAEINNFNFDRELGLNFQVNDDNSFVTTVIPIKLISGPYNVLLDNQKIIFHKYNENGTHVWLNMRPQNAGEILINGTINSDFRIDDKNQLGEFPIEYLGVIFAGIASLIAVIYLKRKK
jgi:hypothetical protein